jgi:hypothetical protein
MTIHEGTAEARTTLPALDEQQIAHVEHVLALARQAPGDWSDMGPFDATQEGDDAYRYQLAYMTYLLGLVQYHYTPAYRELYRNAFSRLITKMLRLDVWGYWELASRGSKVMDPDLVELGEGWADPVRRKNVMYSGHLLMMVGLYEMLYRDGRYDRSGSLTFEHRPPFRGLGPADFRYDHTKLTETIYAEFERNNFLGCECEPNGIFVYCNQFPMLGFLHYDLTHGTDIARPVLQRFRAAWSARSDLFRQEPGDLPVFYLVRQNEVVTEGADENNEAASVLSWGPVMHVWQRQYVERLYPSARDKTVVHRPDGSLCVDMRRFAQAHRDYQAKPGPEHVDPMMLGVHTLGMLALCAAELGDEDTVRGLLAYADAELNPTLCDGRLYYPRCDELDSGRYVTCLTGNVLLGAARLSVRDGFWSLYNRPWGLDDLATPELIDVPYPALRVLQARWHSDDDCLVFKTLGSANATDVHFAVTRLDSSSTWVEIDGVEIDHTQPSEPVVGLRIAWDEHEPGRLTFRGNCVGPRTFRVFSNRTSL